MQLSSIATVKNYTSNDTYKIELQPLACKAYFNSWGTFF